MSREGTNVYKSHKLDSADLAAELLDLRARVAQLEAALREARHDTSLVRAQNAALKNVVIVEIYDERLAKIDAALAQPAESGAKP